MATTQYIGARYVPLFADPLDWSIESTYEALTIVYDSGNSYTSRQAVPKGIDITNTKYWALTGNYNAQIEAYRKEVAAYDGRITENASAIAKEVSRAIAEETSIKSLITKAQTAADNALSLAQTNEKDIATLDSEMAGTADSGLKTLITNNASAISDEVTRAKSVETSLRNIRGLQQAKYEVFTDDKAYANGDTTPTGTNVWTYFKSILNYDVDMQVHNAGSNIGWLKTNASGNNAQKFMENITNSQDETYKKAVDIVILNFGYYDQGVDDDYETAGRNIVNAASNAYPNALICVNPISSTNCYTFTRSDALNFYGLQYGIIRSQVPVVMCPYYVMITLNIGSPHHYYDTANTNPSILNSGGTNSIGAMLKVALTGSNLNYYRNTRSKLASNLDSTYFTSSGSEFSYNAITQMVTLTAGAITCVTPPAHNTVVGKITSTFFQATDDIPIFWGVQNTTTNPLKGYLVLKTTNEIVWRTISADYNVTAGATLRSTGTSWYPTFVKR